MLTRWTLENFKPIRERLDLPTAPLTVLAGLNSSGKSSFLQSILLISQTLATQKLDEPLVLNGSLVRLGTFVDACNDRANNGVIAIGFTLDGADGMDMDMCFEALAPGGTPLGLQTTRAVLTSVNLVSVPYGYSVALRPAGPGEKAEFLSRTFPDLSRHYVAKIKAADTDFTQDIVAAHFVPIFYSTPEYTPTRFVRLVRCAQHIINTFSSSIRYLAPLRVDPNAAQATEMYAPSGQPDDVGIRGEYAAAVYANNYKQPVRWWNPRSRQVETAALEDAMNAWVRHLGVADQVSTRGNDAPGASWVSWMVRSSSKTRERPLQAVGVGVSQVLPILVAGLLAPEGTILVMEQPELHLHERPQARLGDFFYGLTLVGKQVFVETHSAVFINQLRYLMVKLGQEARDAIAVYFVQQDEQGDARFEPIRISKGGAIENWPDGFFDESFRQEDRITEEGIRARGKPGGA